MNARRSLPLLASLLFLAPLASCSGGLSTGENGENVDQVEQNATVCAKGSTVNGIDVSEWQGSIDWKAVKSAGRVFAFARIADGTYHDKTFSTNWPAMKSAGLLRGAYQYFEPGEDPTTQADIVVSAVGKLGDGDLPCVADVEATGGQSAATIVAHLKTWMARVEAGTGQKPIIYTGKYFWEGNVADSTAFNSYWLWHAQYTTASCPNIADAWSDWQFWQYTDAASVGGVSGGVDGDKFNGTLATLTDLATTTPDWGAQYVSQSYPATMKAGEVAKATLVLKNVGAKTWDTKTRIGTTNPRDRVSAFAGTDWVNDHRPDGVSGTVAPGKSYTFTFNLHAPAKTGVYTEKWGVVEEGVAWFSDPGQGGPADGSIWFKITVVPADNPDAGADAGDASPTVDAGGDADAATDARSSSDAHGGDANDVTPIDDSKGSSGCGCAVVGRDDAYDRYASMAGAALVALLATSPRRRRRRAR